MNKKNFLTYEFSNGHAFIDCDAKRIDTKRWNRKFVFRLKLGNESYTVAKSNAPNFSVPTRWVQGEKKRTSTMASLSRGDCNQLVAFKFDEVCGQLLRARLV